MNELKAIKLCMKHRDPRGFEFLVSLYRKKAFFYSAAMLGNREDAADACQEAFAKAFAAISRLERLPAFYPWFVTILRNCCLNMISRRKTFNKYRLSQWSDHSHDSFSPDKVLIKSETEREVWNVLNELKTVNKEMLILKYYQDCSYNEISEILGIPRGTVMSRLYAARKAFKERFEDQKPT